MANFSFVPTGQPTLAPTVDYLHIHKENNWNYIVKIMLYYTYLMAAQLILFEVARGDAFVYGSRMQLYEQRCKGREPPQRSRVPFGWARATLSVSEADLLDFVGLDAFVLIRYIQLCWKICGFATLLCLVVLVPVFAMGNDYGVSESCASGDLSTACQEEYFNVFTLANAIKASSGDEGDDGVAHQNYWISAIVVSYA